MEFLTVATQYCGMLEQCQKQSREELLDSLLRILPVLYWNAQVLPAMETMGQFLPDGDIAAGQVSAERRLSSGRLVAQGVGLNQRRIRRGGQQGRKPHKQRYRRGAHARD